jgi:carbonic anhydrase
MTIYFEQYVNKNIKNKTIVLSCNDSYFANNFIENKNIILCTYFANIIQSRNNIDLDYFKYCIENEGAKEILIIGHYNCKIIPFFLTDKTNNTYWDEARKYFKNLENNPFKKIDIENNSKQMVWLNVIQQMIKISKMNIINNIKGVNIKGIIIDEVKNYEVEEINLNLNQV